MPEQTQIKKSPKKNKAVEAEELSAVDQSEAKEKVAETDKLLDEIDAILDPVEILQETIDKDAPVTLASLMREGSNVTGKATGNWTTREGDTCALSAAALAARARGLV